ncbi:MAG: MBL fold metallo-hydrolase [Prolixibacteraceae bacterium]|nr:MBL fold metallo-hydrolase [Prolixibacteraceae bacterium]
MKLYIITENCAGGKFLAEHGLSYILETDGKKILFDTGHSDIFLKNATGMDIDIEKETDTVVLSHGHWDHGDGLRYLRNKKLIAHPSSFMRRFRKRDFSPVGLSLSRAEIEAEFDLIESKKPLQITQSMYFLGEIPRITTFEAQTTSFVDDYRNDDFIPDDSALAAIVNNELIVVTGCSHSGICNIIEHAKKVTGISTVRTVLGGFHLKENDQQTKKTINYIKDNNIREVYPSHCTELPALSAFYENFRGFQLKTGMVLEF